MARNIKYSADIYTVYSRRVAIIAGVGFWTISRFKFWESAPRQSHTLKFNAIKTTPLFHTCVEITAGSFKHKLTMSMSKSELWSCVVKAMIRGYEYQSIWEAEIGETWRVSESIVTSVTPTLYNNSWTRPKKNVSYIFALFSKRRQYIFRKWLANATNSAFSVQHALWFILITPILLRWWDCTCSS